MREQTSKGLFQIMKRLAPDFGAKAKIVTQVCRPIRSRMDPEMPPPAALELIGAQVHTLWGEPKYLHGQLVCLRPLFHAATTQRTHFASERRLGRLSFDQSHPVAPGGLGSIERLVR